ncbi:MAG: moaD [Rhodocyclales bacterium]|nr:moaD [Rhodocyclales bacterium]
MSITILYFASLREALGVEREQLSLPPGIRDVARLRVWLLARGEDWAPLAAPRIRAAVNQVLASDATTVADKDEIAFFPPVTGG